jgi:DNA-directed RNA polymerase sigma subunit (sigma70/sigma32)
VDSVGYAKSWGDAGMNDYRIEMTVKNNRIFSYMHQMGYESVSAFCRATDMQPTVVGELLNLKRAAIHSKTGEWTVPALKLAEALACSPDDLWTDAQRTAALESNKRAVELSEEDAARIMYDDQDTLLLEMERNESVESVLKKLPAREETIVRMRFGFPPYYEEHTLESVAKEFDVSRNRIMQIEAKALRRLRHPQNSTQLKDFA